MDFLQYNKKSNWIWTAGPYDKENACLIYFRKELILENDIQSAYIKISADSRYRFFVNGTSVSQGPCKGDNQVWYYDEIEISKLLQLGVNVFAVTVLRYPESNEKGNRSVWRTAMPGLYLEGTIVYKNGTELKFGADESWRSFYEDKIKIIKTQPIDRIFVSETGEGDIRTCGWKKTGYNDEAWADVKEYSEFGIKKAVSPGGLSPRPIPFMYETPLKFDSIVCSRTEHTDVSDWQSLIEKQQEIIIPANTKVVIEISAGVEETGFIETTFSNGKGAEISILYSEAYVYQPKDIDKPFITPIKGDRKDYVNGHLEGMIDNYVVGGFGTLESPEEYEPFWFRTFRFIQIAIETKDVPLTITKFSYRETGYPLEVKTKVETSDESLKTIWEISERTLRRCMHETYEDCPFYEQLQYAMDARSQILFTYNISADDRLARKCIDDFFRSQRYDGLINACYPSTGINVIPGFSIYYILMIYDHMMYFGDKKLVEKYMPLVQRILQFFDNRLEKNGLVARTSEGGMGQRYWSFVDWVENWDIGVPTAIKRGPITMESLLYRMGLQAAAELSNFINLPDLGASFLEKSEKVKKAILTYCVGEKWFNSRWSRDRRIQSACTGFCSSHRCC